MPRAGDQASEWLTAGHGRGSVLSGGAPGADGKPLPLPSLSLTLLTCGDRGPWGLRGCWRHSLSGGDRMGRWAAALDPTWPALRGQGHALSNACKWASGADDLNSGGFRLLSASTKHVHGPHVHTAPHMHTAPCMHTAPHVHTAPRVHTAPYVPTAPLASPPFLQSLQNNPHPSFWVQTNVRP